MLAELICALSMAVPAPMAEGPFQEMTFDQALAAAKKDGKIVMIDFFTTWCQPCKRLDKVTWADAGVQKWLGEKTVPLKMDAEKEVELAKRFGVDSYPTMAFVKSDGTKIDSINGFKEPDEFLRLATAILAGKSVVNVEKESPSGHDNDPMARGRYGKTLARSGQYKEALDEYLWCFDHGNDNEMNGYSGVRLSFLLSDIVALGKKYPPAIEALQSRRQAAADQLLAGKGTENQVADVSALDENLGSPRRTVELFDKMKEKKVLTERLRFSFRQEIGKALIEARRYDDFLDGIDEPVKFADFLVSTAKSSLKIFESMKHPEGTENEAIQLRDDSVAEISLVYESLLGTKQIENAGAVGDLILEFAPVGATYSTLIGRALHAENAEAARALVERGRRELPEGERKVLEEAAKKIPAPK